MKQISASIFRSALVLSLFSGQSLATQVILQSQDGKEFKIDKKVAERSEMLEARFRKDGTKKPVEFKNIAGKTLAKIVDILNGAPLRETLPKSSAEVSLILKAFDYLQLKNPLVVNTVADVFGDQIFDTDLKWLVFLFEEMQEKNLMKEYERYVGDVFDDIPEVIEKRIIERKLRSIDRVFLDTTPDRRLNAIESMTDTDDPLVVGQVIAYIAKYQIPSAKELPKLLRTVLKDWLGEDFANKIHFGPWPIEWATWPGHCPLPSDPNYNMYSDATPDDRFRVNGDGTITDVCTKLTWEQTPSMPAAPLRQSQNHCAKLTKANFTDWRAPTRIELQSIVNYNATNPALNAIFGERNARYWSSTALVGYGNRTWTVNFDNGRVNSRARTEDHRMRCVRGERGGALAAGAKKHYTYADTSHTVTDNFTGAVWQRGVINEERNHAAAQEYCTTLELEGRGWTLPTVKALSTLVDVTRASPVIDLEAFPARPERGFWSLDPHAVFSGDVWVYFDSGLVTYGPIGNVFRGRCVR